MKEIKSRAKKWGNSIGVIIPKEVLEEEGVKEGQEIKIRIMNKEKTTVRDLFEIGEKYSLSKRKDKKEILSEVDEELKSKVVE